MLDLDFLLTLGVLAGVFQIIGYYYYLSIDNIDPNPVTWLMFAYGTTLLTILEWENEATLPELLLPVSCSILSIVVAYRCWQKQKITEANSYVFIPANTWDRLSFVLDILITIGYLTAWLLATYALLNEVHVLFAMLLFLWLSNISTITSFIPILRSTNEHPDQEHYLPWLIWTFSYTLLAVTTYLTHGTVWHILMLYPVSNMIFHFWVAYLALPRRFLK